MRAPWASKSASAIALPSPAPRLDEHLVAVLGELADADRRQRDAVLVLLDLGRYSDFHDLPPFGAGSQVAGRRPQKAWAPTCHLPPATCDLI